MLGGTVEPFARYWLADSDGYIRIRFDSLCQCDKVGDLAFLPFHINPSFFQLIIAVTLIHFFHFSIRLYNDLMMML